MLENKIQHVDRSDKLIDYKLQLICQIMYGTTDLENSEIKSM